MTEFDEAKKLANLYSLDLLKVYLDEKHPKVERLDKIIAYLTKMEISQNLILSVGCGAAIMEIEIASRLDRNILGLDCSPTAIFWARKMVEVAVAEGEINKNQVQIFLRDVIKGNHFGEYFSLVFCFDVIAAFSLENKRKFLQKIWKDFVEPQGRLVFTALSCVDEKRAQDYAEGKIVKGSNYAAKLFSENLGAYCELARWGLEPQPAAFNIERLDDECVLVEIRKPA